jgi:hypothetical protein
MVGNQPARVRDLFMTLIRIGFRGFDPGAQEDTTPTFAEMVKVNNDMIRLGFRCDSRDWASVQATGGARRKVKEDTLRRH